MKLSKITRWILTIGILAILLISLGVVYGHQKTEQSELNTDIAQAQQDLSKYATQKEELKTLQTRLSKAKSHIALLQPSFISPANR